MRHHGLFRSLLLVASLALLQPGLLASAADAPAGTAADGAGDPAREKLMAEMRALHWVKGPTSVEVAGNATLKVPEGYVFLDTKETTKFLTLTQNLGSGQEVMIAPEDLHWSAYLEFDDGGYVKDDEKIDAPALLKSLKEANEAGNEERKRRGWGGLTLTGWASPPAYNKETRRLEWATMLRTDGGDTANFFTKVLGRRGHTSVVMAADAAGLGEAQQALAGVLDGFAYKAGERYTEWVPGDKVAEYGLAALILGGATAIATKKGFWAVLGGFFAAAWKFIVAAVVGAGAWLRKKFTGAKQAD
jgi:uncharacterized membrane-anchored protein